MILLLLCSSAMTHAWPSSVPELKTRYGVTYSEVTVTKRTPTDLSIRHSGGAATIPLDNLDEAAKELFEYDAEEARAHTEKKEQETAALRQQQLEAEVRKAEAAARTRAEAAAATAAKKEKEEELSDDEPVASPAQKGEEGLLDTATILKPPATGVFYQVPVKHQRLEFVRATGRRFEIPIALVSNAIQIKIRHGFDNSGDGGLKWELRTASKGQKVARGFTKSRGDDARIIRDIPERHMILILTDEDSNFDGRDPGNGFWLEVLGR